VTPDMAAGVSDRLWSMEDAVALLDAHEASPAKKRESAIHDKGTLAS
jgi:hypothetical protein